MPSIPPRVTTGPSGSTQADVAAAINSLRDLSALTPWAWKPTVATIANGVVAPWAGFGATITSGTAILLDTEGGASTDDLDRIDPQGLVSGSDESRLIALRIVTAARSVKLRNEQGGTGQLITPDGADWTLTSRTTIALAHWDPSHTPPSWRILGVLLGPAPAPFRQWIRLATWGMADRPGPGSGLIGYNTDLQRFEYGDGTSWQVPLANPDFAATRTLQTGSVTYASCDHNFGTAPRLVRVDFECLGAEYGYSVGDRVPIAHARSGDGSVACTVAIGPNSIKVAQRVTPRLIRLDSPGSDFALTATNWRIEVRAWR